MANRSSPPSLLFLCLLVLFPDFLIPSESENQSDDLPSLSTVSSLDDNDDNRRPKKRKVGFHFRPDNDELIDHYLKKKAGRIDEEEINQCIADVDILKYEPHELPALSAAQWEDRCWYFFYRLKNCGRGSRGGNSRKTRNGKWGVTGTTRPVKSEKSNKKIATKKTLTYHPDAPQTSPPAKGKGKAKGKSEWSLHEYHLLPGFTNPENYVIVQLKKKGGKSVQLPPEKDGAVKLPDRVNLRQDSFVAAGYEDHSLETAALYENSPSLGMSLADLVTNQNVSVEPELSGQTRSSFPCLGDTQSWIDQEPNPGNMDVWQGSWQEMSQSSSVDNQAGFKASICNYNPVPDQGLQMTGCDSDNSIDQRSLPLADLDQAFIMLEEIEDLDGFFRSILNSEPSPQSPSSFEQTPQPSQGYVTSHHS